MAKDKQKPFSPTSSAASYDLLFIADACLWCCVATYFLVRAVEENNLLFLIIVGFSESKLVRYKEMSTDKQKDLKIERSPKAMPTDTRAHV